MFLFFVTSNRGFREANRQLYSKTCRTMSHDFVNVLYFFIVFLGLFIFIVLYLIISESFWRIHPLSSGIIIRKTEKENHLIADENSPLLSMGNEVERRCCFGIFKLKLNVEPPCKGLFLKKAKRVKYENSQLRIFHLLESTDSACNNETVINSSCSICLDDFTINEEIVCLFCSHGFHEDCIFDLAKSKHYNPDTCGRFNCPLCNEIIHVDGFNVGITHVPMPGVYSLNILQV